MRRIGGTGALAAVVALVLALAIGGCGDSSDAGSGSTSATTSATGTTGTTDAAAVATIDLRKAGATQIKADGDWLVDTNDAVWLSAGTEFQRLDPKTGKPDGGVKVPGGLCLGGEYAFGALYSATCYADEGLVRIDPKSMKVTDSVKLPTPDIYNQEGTIASGEGAIWVIVDGKDCESCVVLGLDPDGLSTTHELDLTQGAESVAVGGGFVWVSDSEKNRVLQIDPATDKVVGETKVGGLPRYLAADDSGVWVLNQLEGTVTQLDPKTGEEVRTIDADMAGAGGSIMLADGSVWVRGTLTLLKQIDAETGEIVGEYGPDSGSGDSLVRHGVLWISGFSPGHGNEQAPPGVVYRIALSKLD